MLLFVRSYGDAKAAGEAGYAMIAERVWGRGR